MSLTGFQRRRRELGAKLAAEAAENESKKITELDELRARAIELGISDAEKLNAKKLKKAIADKEAELEKHEQEKALQELRAKAAELGIEGVEEKDAETLAAEIEALEQVGKGNE